MSERDLPADLGIRRLLWVFATLSVALLALLAVAPLRDHGTEWRAHQRRYNAAAAQVGAAPVAVGIKQVWRPELERVDRCTSCHLGMGEVTPSPHEPLFRAHPAMPHEPRDFGCTICHRGQGRATAARAAHGQVAFWDDPMLEAPYRQAACGVCHTGVVAGDLDAGRGAFERAACHDCHRVDGKGGTDGPDLSRVGISGFAAGWHAAHLARAAAPAASGDSARGWRARFAALSPADQVAVEGFLRGQLGAPRLVAGKALAARLGCRGCHRIGGAGGDEGPDLSNIGARNPRELDYAGVAGPRTLASWLREHFLDPARVVRQSQMPDLGVTDAEAELLTLYMLSLRAEPVSAPRTPRDRLRLQLGERDVPTDGASLFAAFCSGCHGPAGTGRRFGVGDYTFPAIGGADFLAVVDDGLLRATIASGRPGRKMPAWVGRDGGFTPTELDRVVGYLRSREPAPPAFEAVLEAEAASAGEAQAAWASETCAACHGARGEGTPIGPPLRATDERRLYDVLTARTPGMGSYAALPAPALRGLIEQSRALAAARVDAAPGAPWAPAAGDAARGEPVYAATCAGCHGARGQGNVGPALGNPAFLAAASDAYLRAVIVRGRGDTAMPAFGRGGVGHRQLAASEIADVVAFLRSLAPPPPSTRKGTP